MVDAEGAHEIRGPRQVALLALLAAHRGEVVRTERIEDELWDGRPVSASAVRVNVARLRTWLSEQLGHDPIRSTPLGYALDLDGEQVNSLLYATRARSVAEARSRGQFASAVQQADEADRLWRGRAFEGAVDLPSVRVERERLEALRVDTWQERAISLIELGDFDRALDQIEAMQEVQPYRETAHGLRLIALHRADRRPDALRQYQQTVECFHDELGVAPGSALVDLSAEIVADDPRELVGERYLREVASPTDVPPAVRPLPAGLDDQAGPASLATPFVGRDVALAYVRRALTEPGSVVVVEGPGGIGKTRLAAEVARGLGEAGTAILYGSCSLAEGVGSAPVPDLVAGALGGLVGPEVDGYRSALAALLPRDPAATPPAAEPEVDPETRRLQLHGAVEDLLRRATGVDTLVVVDDVQWIEAAGLRFLRYLLPRLPDVRWLFLARSADRTDAAQALLGDLGRRYAEWVELPPLDADDVGHLVDAVAPPSHSADWQAVVQQRAGGMPFVATALLRHLVSGGDPAALPRGVEHVIRADVARLGADAQVLAELLAVAAGPVDAEVLRAASGIDPRPAARARAELESAGMVEQRPAPSADLSPMPSLSHDLIGEALLADLGPDRLEHHHRGLGRALVSVGLPGHEVEAFSHLLAGGEQVAVAELDEVAADALRVLNLQTSFERVRDLGDRYLRRVGDEASSLGGLDARVQVATSLLAVGETSRGLAAHDAVLPLVKASQDARLLADLVLARGPVDTGTQDASAKALEARLLLDLLPREERSRRVQLACWAAHNLLVDGQPDEARGLIATARAEVADVSLGSGGPVLQGIVAGVTCQAATSVDADPADSVEAYRALAALAETSGLPSAEATRRLFALDQAMRFGDLASLRVAIDDLEAILGAFPRPDLSWWVVAAEAGYALAAGDLATAERELMRALTVGSELSVAPAGPVSLLQRLMVQWESHQLGVMHPVMRLEPRPDAPLVEIALSALVCAEVGDLEGATRAGRRLATFDPLLAGSGPSWPAIATIAAHTALFADLPELAARVEEELRPHAGTGLSFTGLVHFGSCDRLLGLTRATLGDLDGGIDLVEAAYDDLERRTLPTWVAHAAADAARLRRRRAGRGDRAAAQRFEDRADRARSLVVLPEP